MTAAGRISRCKYEFVNELLDTYNPAASAAKKKSRHPTAIAAGDEQWDLVNVA
jgi:hypothetical protein